VETRFPNPQEIDFYYGLIAEWCERNFPRLTFYRLIGVSAFDELHSEARETDKLFTDGKQGRPEPLLLHGYVVPAGETHPLTQWGIKERVRNTSLFICTPHLLAAGLATQNQDKEITLVTGAGDRFLYSRNVLYNILDWTVGPGFANTDITLF